jgi:CHASE2 domain-containing sensor protein
VRYQNFDIEIEGVDRERHVVRAQWQSTRPEPDPILIDQAVRELQRRIAGNEGIDAAVLSDLGRRLYRLLLGGAAGALFRKSVDAARGWDEGVCLRLSIESADATGLPWELIYSPEEECMLAGSQKFPLVRYVRLARPIDAFKIRWPLRMLVVIPNLSGLDTQKEEANLRSLVQELSRDGRLELQVLKGNVTLTQVSDALLRTQFHVFHFIVHGEFVDSTAFLRFNSEQGGSSSVDDLQMCSLLRNQRQLKLVFLNACRGAATSADDIRTGMAPRLVRAGVPAVIAMQYEIQDAAAVEFSREFYASLFTGGERGRVDVAMCHARNVLERDFTGERDICAPVLFMRAPEGVLFDDEEQTRRWRPLIPRREQGRCEAVARTLANNIALRETEAGKDDAELGAERTQLGRLLSTFRRNNISWAMLAGTIIAACVALVFADWINFKADAYVVWVRDYLLPTPLHDDIVLVTIDKDTERHFNKTYDSDHNWRPNHVELIRRLAQAKARVIAFDIFFEKPRDGDAEFVEAIRQANAVGTAVVIATSGFEQGVPKMAPGVGEAVSAWGYGCFARNRFGYATAVPLASKPQNEPGFRPALDLAAFAPGHRLVDVDFEGNYLTLADGRDSSLTKIRFVQTSHASSSEPTCAAIVKGDRVADFIVDVPPLKTLWARRVPYEELADPVKAIDGSRFEHKTVLVGYANDGNMVPRKVGADDEKLYGVEWHASVLSMLMRGAFIGRLDAGVQFDVGLGLALIAGLARFMLSARRSRPYPLALDAIMLVALVALCLVLACVSYVVFHSFMNLAHSLLASFASYLLVAIVQGHWMSAASSPARNGP